MTSANNSLEEQLKALIKEAILNEDVEMLESLLDSEDKALLQEALPVIPLILGAMSVGGAVWASDALGVTDNWYDKAVKYIDPMHYVSSAIGSSPMFGETPDRAESGWLSKGIANKFKGEDFGKGIEKENKSDITKRFESGATTTRDIAQVLYNAMDGPGSGVAEVQSILTIDPSVKPGTVEHLTMVGLWSEVYEKFHEVTTAEDDSDKDKDLIWWLKDEGDFPEEAEKMKELLAIYKLPPEELRNMYPDLENQAGAELAREEGASDEAVEIATGEESGEDGSDDSAFVPADTGGFAMLGAGAANIGKTKEAAASLFSAYETLKNKPEGERTEEESELLGILGNAAAS